MTNTPAQSPLANKMIGDFEGFERRLNGEAKNGIHSIRRDAIKEFERTGFPTIRNEEWKYTSLANVTAVEWNQPEQVSANDIDFERIKKQLPKGYQASVLVFVDGQFIPEASQIHEEAGVSIMPLSLAIKEKRELVDKHFAKYAAYEKKGTVALNTAYAKEGVFIHVPKNQNAKTPVHIVYVSGFGDKPIINLRNLIILEEGARFEMLETFISYGDYESFTNIVGEYAVAERASLEHYKVQIENEKATNINLTQIDQQANSLCNQRTVTLGGNLVRNDLNFHYAGKHSESHLYGLYIPAGKQLFDNHSFVDHAMPECFSNEFYKGIMMQQGTGVFNGKIMVRQDAQKTNAYQSNKNILLSKEAKINTKPQLEIFADDVKCSHGATIGQLDENALFYLRARGIGETDARAMLTYAFAEEVIENIASNPIKEWVDGLMAEKLKS